MAASASARRCASVRSSIAGQASSPYRAAELVPLGVELRLAETGRTPPSSGRTARHRFPSQSRAGPCQPLGAHIGSPASTTSWPGDLSARRQCATEILATHLHAVRCRLFCCQPGRSVPSFGTTRRFEQPGLVAVAAALTAGILRLVAPPLTAAARLPGGRPSGATAQTFAPHGQPTKEHRMSITFAIEVHTNDEAA